MMRFFAVPALLLLVAAQSGYAQCSAADKVALEAFDKAWGDAGQRGDKAFLENVYAPNFVGHAPGGMTDRATTIASTMTTAEQNRVTPQPVAVPDHYMITCSGNTATITHRNTIRAAAGGDGSPVYSRSIHFLEKSGNRWQAVSSSGNQLGDGALLAYMELDWNEAARKRDLAWYERNYASYATDVSGQTGLMENKAKAMESLRTDKRVLESLQISDMNVRVDGNMAVVTGVNHVKGRDADGKPMDSRTRFTDTFVKKDGKWMVWATQGTLVK